MESTGTQVDGGIAELIPIYNKIQDLLEDISDGEPTDIQLPRIAVIGSQSSGKSSVLESLVGQPFLPKGTGVVTRCPIVLRLINVPEGETTIEFEHQPGQQYNDPAEVEAEIIAETQKIAGDGTNITHKPIKITVHSPNVLSFTVVDLPGIVKNPDTTQAADIEVQIKDLIMSYIGDENTVILAISKGNDDINNSDSLNMAKLVDPTQSRTLAVVTKLDLADDKEKMLDTLSGKIVPVKLGFVGVINRTKEDLQKNKPFPEVLEFEKQFIQKTYPSIARHHGISILAQKLHRILSKHIAAHCPGLMLKLGDRQMRSEEELTILGADVDLTPKEKLEVLSKAIDKFSKDYKAQVDGQSRSDMRNELTKGTVINHVINYRLTEALQSLEPFKGLSDAKVLIAIRNVMPVGNRMITPEVALNHFIKAEINKVGPIALNIAKLVYQEMQGMISTCLEDCPRFPRLNSAISAVVSGLIDERMVKTKEILAAYFEVQTCAAWTANIAYGNMFKDTFGDLSAVDTGNLPMKFVRNNVGMRMQQGSGVESSEPEVDDSGNDGLSKDQVELCNKMRTLALNMFEIVRWQLQDFIAKAILTWLIYKTVDEVAVALNVQLNTPEKIEEIVQEGEEIQSRRLLLKKEIEHHKEALMLLNKAMNDAM